MVKRMARELDDFSVTKHGRFGGHWRLVISVVFQLDISRSALHIENNAYVKLYLCSVAPADLGVPKSVKRSALVISGCVSGDQLPAASHPPRATLHMADLFGNLLVTRCHSITLLRLTYAPAARSLKQPNLASVSSYPN